MEKFSVIGALSCCCLALPPNEPLATGKEPIRKVIGDLYAMPGLSVKWQPTKVEVARSGDISPARTK